MYDTLKPELLTATPEQRESILALAHMLCVCMRMVFHVGIMGQTERNCYIVQPVPTIDMLTMHPNTLLGEAMASTPSHVVSWELFQHNQLPYLELRRPFILGTNEAEWRPTVAHFFMRVCADRGLLRRVYTQNIDGLDQVWGRNVIGFGLGQIKDGIVFYCHASHVGFASVRCYYTRYAQFQSHPRLHVLSVRRS